MGSRWDPGGAGLTQARGRGSRGGAGDPGSHCGVAALGEHAQREVDLVAGGTGGAGGVGALGTTR